MGGSAALPAGTVRSTSGAAGAAASPVTAVSGTIQSRTWCSFVAFTGCAATLSVSLVENTPPIEGSITDEPNWKVPKRRPVERSGSSSTR